jgi:hypothetical protein
MQDPVSLAAVHARIAELQSAFAPLAPPPPAPAPAPATSFSGLLHSATSGPPGAPGVPGAPGIVPAMTGGIAAPGTPAGQAMIDAVRGEVGQAEQPPGSNDSPRIAQYRQATAGSAWARGVRTSSPGPRARPACPWATRARASARWTPCTTGPSARARRCPPAPGTAPQPGDLIVWDEHIGLVESVSADGTVNTIEGNSSDQVSRRSHPGGGGAVGYVRLG